MISNPNELIENLLTSFANRARRLVENKADVLEDSPESLGSQLQIIRLLFENLTTFSQTKTHSCLRGIHTGAILFAFA